MESEINKLNQEPQSRGIPGRREDSWHARYRAIIFDLEGVLIDTEPLWDEAQSMLLQRRGVAYDRGRVKHLLAGRSQAEGIGVLTERFGLREDVTVLLHERLELFRAMLEGKARPIPGALEFVRRVRQSNQALAVATSLDRTSLASVIDAFSLEELFSSHIYCVDDVGHAGKPAPDLFLYATSKLGVAPADCLVIEDSPQGVRAAKNAGMDCLVITTTFSASILREAGDVRLFSSFSEL